ncbi:SKU5 similar 18 [Forsythia ovata]|uniref:SKU5 similar 18 n=1 Tax=Forsythia ovata TaxID=205694 RepID=A0ABD1PWE7_9LAMI
MLVLENNVALIDGKYRYTLNGVSFVHPDKLADYFQLPKVFKPGIIPDALFDCPPGLGTRLWILNAMIMPTLCSKTISFPYKHGILMATTFSLLAWNTDMEREEDGHIQHRDAIYRSTVQVYPLSWTAILIKLDNQGMWNLRSQDAEKRHLGQELYIRVKGVEKDPSKISPRDEAPIPKNIIKCGRGVQIY